MWLSSRLVEIFGISKESFDDLRQELATTKAERDSYKEELSRTTIMADWLRMQINQLQIERTQLLDKAYGIKTPIPEIARARHAIAPHLDEFSFEDVGDEMAKKLGLPTYHTS
jgi:hypothetical protein